MHDEFAELLSPEGAPLGEWSRQDGEVRIEALARTDLFVSPAGGVDTPSVGRLVTTVRGDFVFSARVEVDFRDRFDAGVIYVEYDENLWFKLCLEFTPLSQPSVVSVVTRGVSDDANSWVVAEPGSYLRVSRMGHAFALHASTDGDQWSLVRHFSLGLAPEAPVKLGVLAQSPHGEGCAARFTQLRYEERTLGDIRSGE